MKLVKLADPEMAGNAWNYVKRMVLASRAFWRSVLLRKMHGFGTARLPEELGIAWNARLSRLEPSRGS